MNRGLMCIGEGIAFAGLCVALAWCETHGYDHPALWLLVALWILFFGPKDKKGSET